MKTKNLIFFPLLGIILLSGACKKSENDPFLPFSSRDARIAKNWELTELNNIETDTVTAGSIHYITRIEYEFTGEKMKVTTETISENTVVSYPYSRSLNIDKNGSYTNAIRQDENNDGDYEETQENGYWFWLDGNRKKTAISFSEDEDYIINRLANDELILNLYRYEKYLNAGNIVSKTREYIITFKKQ